MHATMIEPNAACSDSACDDDARSAWLRYIPRLESCPGCAYSLLGLPDRHHCPECGLEYGPDTIGWRPEGTVKNLKLSVVMFLLVASGLYFILPMTALLPTRPERTTIVYFGLAVWAIFIARDFLWSLSGPYLVLNRHGLLIKDRSRPRTIPWNAVDEIETSRIGSRRTSRVKLRGKLRPLYVTHLLGNKSESHDRFNQIARAFLRSNQRQADAG